jgi:3-hydroxyisobutyrate dehydrogenase
MDKKVCFVGLGNMGFPMAGWLSQKGYQTTVYNRTFSKTQVWLQKYQGEAKKTPALAAEDADFVMICVGNDQDVLAVLEGEQGVLAGMKKGAILVDHTTTSADLAKRVNKNCEELGLGFLDAPVSGGQAGAENGKLTVMVGGEENFFQQAEPIIDSYSQKVVLMGEVGQGQLTKMVNQICIAGLLQALSEAIYFGEKKGVDLEKAMGVLSKGAAQSWQMENRHKTMIQGKFDFGFALDWMRKDLGFCLKEAEKSNMKLPITELVDSYYELLQTCGKGRLDTSALIENLRQRRITK